MIETEKGKRIEQILATDVTREQLAEALWCAESSQRMWHGCAEENRNFRLKAEAENAKLQDENARLRSCLSDDAENARMIMAENAKLRELVRCLVYATHPLDRATLVANAAELGIEVQP